jgi:hypothetical protein
MTTVSYRDNLQFGLAACRMRVPQLQRLLIHLENGINELENAT